MSEKMTCIMCPVGCELTVEQTPDGVCVSGNRCVKGIEFATEELLDPKRNLATSLPINGTVFKTVSVRLNQRVSRKMLDAILAEIRHLHLSPPVKCGDVLITDILGTGADVIATRTVK